MVKVGVGILDDLMKLNSDCGVPIGEFLDVGAVVKRIDNLDKTGLKHIMKHYFKYDLLTEMSCNNFFAVWIQLSPSVYK